MSTPIIAAVNILNNLFSSFYQHQSVKVTQQHQTTRTGIYADMVEDSAQIINSIANAYIEYRKVVEQERTKRKNIEAWEKEAIARIEAQKEVLITFLHRSFDERDKIFTSFFKVVDTAVETGNNQQLAEALASITNIAKTSPLDGLVSYSSFQAKLDDPNHKWQF